MARLSKVYYRIVFDLKSPLSVGSGANNETDSDIILNSLGQPYIPGTAIAGVLRALLPKEKRENVFGDSVKKPEENNDDKNEKNSKKNKDDDADKTLRESPVITYDATLQNPSKGFIFKRDMVALDDYKVAKDGAKFDFQILEPGVTFVTFIEVNGAEESDVTTEIESLLAHWNEFGLSFGSKTMRGYGLTEVKEIKRAKPESWLDFDVYDEADTQWETWSYDGTVAEQDVVTIKLELEQKSALSIREYFTEPDKPDYRQMKLISGSKEAVIPGTSWAGAFRAQMKKLGMSKEELEELFGTIKAKEKTKKDKDSSEEEKEKKKEKSPDFHRSRIYFSESYIEGGERKVITRNAIDRFTGGTVDGALYTEETLYGGTTDLTIKCEKQTLSKYHQYLAAAIMDLNAGYLSIGGLTSVGRGLFEVSSVTVNEKPIGKEYSDIAKALKGE